MLVLTANAAARSGRDGPFLVPAPPPKPKPIVAMTFHGKSLPFYATVAFPTPFALVLAFPKRALRGRDARLVLARVRRRGVLGELLEVGQGPGLPLGADGAGKQDVEPFLVPSRLVVHDGGIPGLRLSVSRCGSDVVRGQFGALLLGQGELLLVGERKVRLNSSTAALSTPALSTCRPVQGVTTRKRKSMETMREEQKKKQKRMKRNAKKAKNGKKTKKKKGDESSSSDEDDDDQNEEGATTSTADGKRKKSKKRRNMRRNIKEVLAEKDLEETTRKAQAQEQERLQRLQEQRRQKLQEAYFSEIRERTVQQLQQEQHRYQQHFEEMQRSRNGGGCVQRLTDGVPVPAPPVVSISSSEEDASAKQPAVAAKDDSDDVKILTEDEEDGEDAGDDPNNFGTHVDDRLNVPDDEGRVLVNPDRAEEDEPDIYLAPQLSRSVKPHQIGGVRFLYENVVESTLQLARGGQGFGCILAHAMGLGKTLQIVSFCDVFLRHTVAKHVLCVVPINTVQNWIAEFDYWLPAEPEGSPLAASGPVLPRSFGVHVLNDALKNLEARGKVIMQWKDEGGVLLIGYELYRQLASKKPRKARKKKGPECVDLEEEDNAKILLDRIQTALVEPGPDLVICDEGHRIKNSLASTSQALKAIRTKRRIVLTGYPLQNNLMEYWCMVDFVRPNFLGTKTEFSNMFERPIQNGQCVDSTPRDVRLMMHRAHVLHQQLKGFVQRRGHAVLRASLPPKTEHVLLLRMTAVQRRLYRAFMEELFEGESVTNPLKAFAVCCKIWNHPDVLSNFVKSKKEADDLDLDVEEEGAPAATNGKGKGGGKKKKASKQEAPAPPPAQADGFFNAGPGFSPYTAAAGGGENGAASKKGEISYDWAEPLLADYASGRLENSSKFSVFFAILEETVKAGDRLLLFSQSLFTLDLLEEFLQKANIPGKLRVREREPRRT